MTRTAAIALMVLTVSGCASPRASLPSFPEADITTAEQVRSHLHRPDSLIWIFMILAGDEPDDSKCPVQIRFGNSVTWVGGCTDEDGLEWAGSKRVRVGVERMTIRFHEYGTSEASFHGRLRTSRRGLTIELRYDDEDGRHVMIFDGRRSQPLPLDGDEDGQRPVVWSGTGSFASDEYGKVDFETYEVRDKSVCKTEPLSGSTRLSASGHTVEVIYDGAIDCDPEGLATWTLDGVPMGELQIPTCSVSDNTRSWPGLFVIMIVAAGRRRARRDPGP